MAATPRIKQIQGLQSTLDALAGIDVIVESYSTTATDGDTGITITQPARETDAIKVHINGVLLQEGYSWKKDGIIVTADNLEAGTELVWDSSTVGYDIGADDEIQITYETLTSGNTLQGNSGISGTVTGSLIPDSNEEYDLGSPTNKFRDLYLSGNTLYMGSDPVTVSNGQLTVGGNPVSGPLTRKEVFTLNYPPGVVYKPGGNDGQTNAVAVLVSNYMDLNIGDHILESWTPDYFKSLKQFQSSNDLWDLYDRKKLYELKHEPGSTFEYEVGSFSGTINFDLRTDIGLNNYYGTIDLTDSIIILFGIENIDPTWPGPIDSPTTPSSYVSLNANSILDQHVRWKALDFCKFSSGTIADADVYTFSSDFAGQQNTNIDLTNYLAFGITVHFPDHTGTPTRMINQGEKISASITLVKG